MTPENLNFAIVVTIISVALIFDFINGFHDSANAIATIVSTRVLAPKWAVLWAAFFNFVAIAVVGTTVAQVVASTLQPEVSTKDVILAALLGAVAWNLITWYFGIPSSSSHALIGGLVGAGLAAGGFSLSVVKWGAVQKPLIGIVLAPTLCLALGFLAMVAILWICRNAPPGPLNKVFKKLQLASSAVYSISHGGNDAQKTVGVICMLLASEGFIHPSGAWGNVSITPGSSQVLSVQASDSDGDPLAYLWQIDGAPQPETASKFTFNQTTIGDYQVRVTVRDGRGGQASFTWTIHVQSSTTLNHPPWIKSVQPVKPVRIAIGSSNILSVNVRDPDQDPLTYQWDIDGALASGSGSKFTFVASTPGDFHVRVTASDGRGGQVNYTWPISVSAPLPPPNQLPVISSANPSGKVERADVPYWVIVCAFMAIAMGTISGGWRIVKTMGSKITKLRPVDGFAAETAGGVMILAFTHFGMPVSTTHSIAGSIMGVGSTKRLSAVRWGISAKIVWAWIITIPATAALAILSFWICHNLLGPGGEVDPSQFLQGPR